VLWETSIYKFRVPVENGEPGDGLLKEIAFDITRTWATGKLTCSPAEEERNVRPPAAPRDYQQPRAD
jgi:hypothetical protein